LVRELIAARPDLTLDEELHQSIGNHGVHVGRSSVNRFLRACGLTLKKSRFMPPSSSGRTVAAARENWRAAQPHLDPDRAGLHR
jgi:transposase